MAWPDERARTGGIDEVPVPGAPGRLLLCGKHAIAHDPDGVLRRIGGDVVVCLNEEHELVDRYPTYVEWLASDHGRSIVFPIPDLHAPNVDEVLPLLDSLRARLVAGDAVIVHCGAGIGRAGTIAAALLITFGASVDDALATVAASRPMAGPQDRAQASLLHALAARRSE